MTKRKREIKSARNGMLPGASLGATLRDRSFSWLAPQLASRPQQRPARQPG